LIFTDAEMRRRLSAFRGAMARRGLDAAFVHTADNVFYLSGVPLLSEWGRPLWLVVGHDDLHVICARIETENARSLSHGADLHPYDDDSPAIEQGTQLVARLLQSIGADRGVTGIERQRLPLGIFERLTASLSGARFADASDALDKLRIIKSAEELELLLVAAEISKTGAGAFLDAVSDGATELAVAAQAVAAMDTALAERYPAGASSSYAYCQAGEHTLTPHMHPTGRRIAPGDVLALNVFPVVWGYCVELERTFVFGESTTTQHRALSAVNDAFEAAKTAVAPGVPMSDIDALSTQILGQHGFGEFIRHGSGHAHGIMIGAAGREELGELRSYNATALRPGMATSVEPGIYVPDLGGFRHSDVLLVTQDGACTVTDFPRDIEL
jgi:Xaa-Pro aminopeptidase